MMTPRPYPHIAGMMTPGHQAPSVPPFTTSRRETTHRFQVLPTFQAMQAPAAPVTNLLVANATSASSASIPFHDPHRSRSRHLPPPPLLTTHHRAELAAGRGELDLPMPCAPGSPKGPPASPGNTSSPRAPPRCWRASTRARSVMSAASSPICSAPAPRRGAPRSAQRGARARTTPTPPATPGARCARWSARPSSRP